jgi:hypothetical protein
MDALTVVPFRCDNWTCRVAEAAVTASTRLESKSFILQLTD